MSVNWEPLGSPENTLIFFLFKVKAWLRVTVSLDKAKVDQVNSILLLALSNTYIIRLNITVQVAHLMHKFNTVEALNSYKKNGFQWKLALTKLEQLCYVGPKQLQHHTVILILYAFPEDLREASAVLQILRNFSFILENLVVRAKWFQLNRNLLICLDVLATVEEAKASLT